MKNTVMTCAMLAIAAPALVAPASAAPLPVGPDPLSVGWKELTFDGKTPNRWSAEDDALRVDSRGAVSMLYFPVSQPAGRLCWRWRVDSAPPPTDLARKGGDDRALSVTAAFAYDSAKASFGERIRRTFVEAAAGKDAPGRTVDFIWGGQKPPGAVYENPYSGSYGRHIVRRASEAPLGEWLEESVDLSAAYKTAFGQDAAPLLFVAIAADSDDTGADVRALVKDIRLGADCPAP